MDKQTQNALVLVLNQFLQTKDFMQILEDIETIYSKSTKNEVLKGDVKELTKEMDKIGMFDIHSENKRLLDKDYAKDKLNATESK